MPLTDAKIRNAKPGEKPIKLFDERGLYLEVAPSGGKWWRFKYQFEGKDRRISLGVYPEIGLKEARDRRDEARKQLAEGIDPSAHRKATKAARAQANANSFEVVAREWLGKQTQWTPEHAERTARRLEAHVFPWLGTRPVGSITPPELLAVLRRVESRGILDTAHRTLQNCGAVFRYAVATGRAERDPSGDLRGALAQAKGGHFPAVTEPDRVAELLRMIDGYQGTPAVTAALRLAPLVFVRPGELRQARWADIDLDAAEWRYTVTKTKTPHIVPLSTQAVAILRELEPITSRSAYVFPSARGADRPMSDNAILAALRRLGIPKDEMSGHGFRAMARTILDEVLGFRPDFIEHQLAHAVRDTNGRAYNRTSHLEARRLMMQGWADYLDGIKQGAKVIPLRRSA
ncbi:tyrosine-type recombinase/integrase [Allochromatium vinosum]|uniref:tyrosine-type recombinase/integrase n=1 Tax=Allochromatium vinosum TaxID=1049 RepID=UPI0019089EC1|nr:integrase arm-type DNA-binding domain-containing protein [Allochromatium vinosum]MBK1655290.1 integrase [Allochromatium vinosum]